MSIIIKKIDNEISVTIVCHECGCQLVMLQSVFTIEQATCNRCGVVIK